MPTDVQGEVPAPAAARPQSGVLDLRGAGRTELRYPLGDLLVVSGLPGSGKSTLIRRAVAAADGRGATVHRVDSQDSRDRIERRTPPWVPYALYRPLVRLAHYGALRRALRSDASVVVHDCGEHGWVRAWLAHDARRRGGSVHVLLLAVEPRTALAGQAARGRTVSRHAFARHRRAMTRLLAAAAAGRVPSGAVSTTLLDRPAADALRTIAFG
ncbi:AAA family ATPase [Streptomyces cinnamoneus]|uniref:ATP-binding protein n=1 Tax=Streptomyces cinnamoneus TaxID=53446 RepID=A0A918WID6_STRCJ|nr:ATP-binding protein [Streptomyces cinnamoneus]